MRVNPNDLYTDTGIGSSSIQQKQKQCSNCRGKLENEQSPSLSGLYSGYTMLAASFYQEERGERGRTHQLWLSRMLSNQIPSQNIARRNSTRNRIKRILREKRRERERERERGVRARKMNLGSTKGHPPPTLHSHLPRYCIRGTFPISYILSLSFIIYFHFSFFFYTNNRLVWRKSSRLSLYRLFASWVISFTNARNPIFS